MQLGDARDAVAQRGDLADHVHAALPLLGGVDGDELGVGAVDALRRDPQAADVELLEAAAQLLSALYPLWFSERLFQERALRSRSATIDTGLMRLRDIASELTLAQTAMDAERGAVLSEERLRDTPAMRGTKQFMRQLFPDDIVNARWPIGQTEVGIMMVTAYDNTYAGPAIDPEEGERLAGVIGDKKVLMMANHGVATVGKSVAEAYDLLYYTERVAQVQILGNCSPRW